MNAWNLPWTGGCRCGQVRLRITTPPLLTMACHCTGCQRMTASAFSLSAAIASDGFAITKGEPVIGGLHGATRHYFCPHCLSWLFTLPERVDEFVNIRTTLLDNVPGLEPFIETCTREKLPWAVTPAVHSFEMFPAQKEYAGLVEEYARHATNHLCAEDSLRAVSDSADVRHH